MIDPSAVTLPLALLAGFMSFISPCVLPLVPAYIGYLTGQAANTASSTLAMASAGPQSRGASAAQATPSRWIIALHGLFFVLGFSIVFVLLGITAGTIGQISRQFNQATDWIMRIGGLLIIVLGLHTMGVIRIPFLYYDTRRQSQPKYELGYLGSLFMGVTFSAGWSPCLGPILAAMLTLGASTGSAGRAAVLLTAYAIGLGIPFMLAALLLDRVTDQLRRLRKYMRIIEIVSGLLLIAVGVLVFSGAMQRLLAPLAGNTDLTIAIDRWLVNLVGGGE
ncbi:MAG: cytochrome c biogenesis protein CcdA [Aggregatilineales bacterium]|nr:cytochrome c biogenesis protein CcdA [Aggregatilineales bacterium]